MRCHASTASCAVSKIAYSRQAGHLRSQVAAWVNSGTLATSSRGHIAYPKSTICKTGEAVCQQFDCGLKQCEIVRRIERKAFLCGARDAVRRRTQGATLSTDIISQGRRPEPHRPIVRRECKGATLELLWNEYKVEHLEGYAYT